MVKIFEKKVAGNGRARLYFCGVRVASWHSRKHERKHERKKLELLMAAVADPDGFGGLALKLHVLGVPRHHQRLFYEMPAGAVCVDCGANIGKFTDAVLHQGGVSVAFEPNPLLAGFLSRKYAGNPSVRICQAAVGTRDGTALFALPENMDHDWLFATEGGTLERREGVRHATETRVVDLATFLKKEFSAGAEPPVWLLKLDIEGGEFEVVEHLVAEGAHKLARHIVVETHARFFPDGEERLSRLRRRIAEAGADNISLDWV